MQPISWMASEHRHSEKSSDWFWALGILAVAGAIIALLFANVLFALLITVAATTLALLVAQPAQEISFSVTERGVLVNDTLYPYQLLKAFYIDEETEHGTLLIIDARRMLMPHLIIPLPAEYIEPVRTLIANFLPEEELHEPAAQQILEIFGF